MGEPGSSDCDRRAELARRARPAAVSCLGVAVRAFMPMAMLSLIFTVVGIVLLNQPMGMRHGP